MKIKTENKKIETIRVNDKLALMLEEIPKGISYANWLIEKIERLEAHEENAICWVISTSNIGPNRMSVGDENGEHPIFDEVIEIDSEIPRTNMSNEERVEGWLGSNNEYSSYAHGGFASVESARTYITEYMGGRLIDLDMCEDVFPQHKEIEEAYTTAKFDKYDFLDSWFSVDEPDVSHLSDEEIEKLAEVEEKEAKEQGIGLIGDIEEYLMKLRDLQNK